MNNSNTADKSRRLPESLRALEWRSYWALLSQRMSVKRFFEFSTPFSEMLDCLYAIVVLSVGSEIRRGKHASHINADSHYKFCNNVDSASQLIPRKVPDWLLHQVFSYPYQNCCHLLTNKMRNTAVTDLHIEPIAYIHAVASFQQKISHYETKRLPFSTHDRS